MKKLISFAGMICFAILLLCGTIENGIFLALLSILGIYIFVKKVPIRHFTWFLIAFSLLTKLIVVFLVDTPIVGDFVLMYDTAKHMACHNLQTLHPYFNIWGYQLFHVFYEAAMLSIWNSATFLKILNCLYATGITVLIYQIVKKWGSESSARITSLLYAISLYPLYLNTILGNQQLALFLALLAIYLLLYKKQTSRNILLVGILLALSHLERNEGIIYLLTTIIYLFLNKKSTRQALQNILLVSISFFVITQLSSQAIIHLQINTIGFGNANPEWKFLLGFNEQSNGVYDEQDEFYAQDLTIQHEELIKRITNIKVLPKLFYNKLKIQFLYADFGATFDTLNEGKLNFLKEMSKNYVRVMNFFIIACAFLGTFAKEKKKETSFFSINALLFVGVYLLIEICARYYFNPQVTFFMLASIGIEMILKKLPKEKMI